MPLTSASTTVRALEQGNHEDDASRQARHDRFGDEDRGLAAVVYEAACSTRDADAHTGLALEMMARGSVRDGSIQSKLEPHMWVRVREPDRIMRPQSESP